MRNERNVYYTVHVFTVLHADIFDGRMSEGTNTFAVFFFLLFLSPPTAEFGHLVIPIIPPAEPPRVPSAPAQLTVTWQTENSALANWLPPLSSDVRIDEYKVLVAFGRISLKI